MPSGWSVTFVAIRGEGVIASASGTTHTRCAPGRNRNVRCVRTLLRAEHVSRARRRCAALVRGLLLAASGRHDERRACRARTILWGGRRLRVRALYRGRARERRRIVDGWLVQSEL